MCAALYPGDIDSVYGPHGKNKILVGVGGDLVVTRDGGQLLDHCCSTNPAHFLASRLLKNHSSRHGDGTLTLGIILSNIYKQLLDRSLECRSDSTESTWRVGMDVALRRVQCVLSSVTADGTLQNFLVSNSLWRLLPVKGCIKYLWMGLLVPATNKNASETIVALMEKWVLSYRDLDLERSARHAVLNFDSTVFTEIGFDFSMSSPVPLHDVVISGRCKSFAAVSQHKDQIFICFRALWAVSTEANVTINAKVTNGIAGVGWIDACCKRATQIMKFTGIRLLLIFDKVDNDIYLHLALMGIAVIDCIPSDYAGNFLAKGVNIFCDQYDFLSRFDSENGIFAQVDDCSIPLGYVASVGQISRLFLPASTNANTSVISFHMRNVLINNCETVATTGLCQLILRAPSFSAASLYRRLVLRCLKLLLSTIEASSRRTDHLSSHMKRYQGDEDILIVPGSGSAEMLWSSIWECAANEIISITNFESSTGNGPIFQLGKWLALRIVFVAAETHIPSSKNDISSIDAKLHDCRYCPKQFRSSTICVDCEYALCTLARKNEKLRTSLNFCRDVCQIFATAYRAPPKLLAINAAQTAISSREDMHCERYSKLDDHLRQSINSKQPTLSSTYYAPFELNVVCSAAVFLEG